MKRVIFCSIVRMKFAAEIEVNLSITISAKQHLRFDQSRLIVAFQVMRCVLATFSLINGKRKFALMLKPHDFPINDVTKMLHGELH